MASRQVKTRGMVSLAEAADLAGVSIRTLRRRIADGVLPAYRTGPRLIRLDPADLLELIKPMNETAADRLGDNKVVSATYLTATGTGRRAPS